jgi:hypothetical protein
MLPWWQVAVLCALAYTLGVVTMAMFAAAWSNDDER